MYIFYISIDISLIINTDITTNISFIFIFTPVITAGREAEKFDTLDFISINSKCSNRLGR